MSEIKLKSYEEFVWSHPRGFLIKIYKASKITPALCAHNSVFFFFLLLLSSSSFFFFFFLLLLLFASLNTFIFIQFCTLSVIRHSIAMTETVIRRLLAPETWVPFQAISCGISCDKIDTRSGFSPVLLFPLSVEFHYCHMPIR